MEYQPWYKINAEIQPLDNIIIYANYPTNNESMRRKDITKIKEFTHTFNTTYIPAANFPRTLNMVPN